MTEKRPPDYRLALFRLLVVVAFGALAAQMLRLQVAQGATYRKLADENRFREVAIPAPRGVMYDRNGRLLVRNVPNFNVTITPAYLPQDPPAVQAIYAHLAARLHMPITSGEQASLGAAPGEPGIKELVEAGANAPYRPVVIKKNVDRRTALILQEELAQLPGVAVELEPVREYTTGSLTAALIGFMTRVPQEAAEDYIAQGYDPATDRVGASGLEAMLEDVLRGVKGRKIIEEDVLGHELRTVGRPEPATPGNSVILTLDLELQQIVEDALRRGMDRVAEKLGHPIKSGVVVVLNPQTGEVLASVSLPTYDNNLFSRGISDADLKQLYEDPYTPLINHAIAGQYPPGSTFKIVTAAAALQEGVINRHTTIYDPGRIVLYNQPFVCWKASGHGSQDVVQALAHSCDVFFYEVAGGYPPNNFPGLGIDRLAAYAQAFGFGAPTGIGLPGEASGLVPTEKWKRLTYGELWTLGDSYNAGIGQGFVTVTPLQLANAFAALANGGTLYQTQLVREIRQGDEVVQEFTPKVIRQLPVSAENLAIVRQGLREAVVSPGGTAWLANLPEVEVAAKTGTAEFCDNIAVKEGFCQNGKHLPTHAWFAAFAPYENPEIVITVFLYNAGQGSESAAPIAAEILKAYFERQNGTLTGEEQ